MEQATDFTREVLKARSSFSYKVMKGTAYLLVGSLLLILGVFLGILLLEVGLAVIK